MHPPVLQPRPATGRYGVMLVAVAAAVVLRSILSQGLGSSAAYVTLYPAVAVSAWYGGLGPGLAAVGLSALLGILLFVEPAFSFQVRSFSDGLGLLSFIAGGTFITWLNDRTFRATAARERAEAMQLDHHRWCMDTMDSIGDGVICTDVDALITYMNPVAETLTGWELDQAKGRRLDEVFKIINEETRGPAVNPIRRVLQEGIVLGLANHTLLIRRDGSEIPIDDSGAPIRNVAKMINGAVLVFRDISERKVQDDTMRDLTASLRRSNEDLQAYAHAISHDLQEPLRNIRTFAQLFVSRYRGKLDADADTYLGFIDGGAARMSAMIRGLLNLSRLGYADVEFKSVRLDQAVNWAEANLETAIRESHAVIRCEDLPSVHGDQVLLVQLFQNLISNSIKYRRPEAAPEVRIRAFDGGERWTVEVMDNGIGISADDRQFVFDLFKRANNEEAGFGVGLALCRRIVERHGGQIWVEPPNGDGPGTAIRFTLPKA